MPGGLALVVVSERSADQRLFREVAMLTAKPPSLADFSLHSGQSEVAHVRGL